MLKVVTMADCPKILKNETMVNIHKIDKVAIMVLCHSSLITVVASNATVNNQHIIQLPSSHKSHILTRLSHCILIRNPDLVMLSVDVDQYTILPELVDHIRGRILMFMT